MLTTVTLLCAGETCTSISVSELSSPALRPTCRTSCWCLLSPARRSTPATRMFSGAPGGAADVPASTRLTMWLTYPVSAQPAPATNSTRAETMPPVTRSDRRRRAFLLAMIRAMSRSWADGGVPRAAGHRAGAVSLRSRRHPDRNRRGRES